MVDIDGVETPGGTIAALISESHDEYPGIAIEINGVLAAVVEWHEVYRCFVLRTYTQTENEPWYYHRWPDGADIG